MWQNLYMFNFFYNLSNNFVIAQLALLFSHEITYMVIALLLAWAVLQKHKRMFSFSLIFLSGFSAWLFSNIFKNIFAVNRPFMTHDIIPLVFEKGHSFPSMHASIFFALAFATYSLDRNVGIFMYILAILIGISRMIIGVHYPVDILGGAVLGLIIGFVFVKIFRRV